MLHYLPLECYRERYTYSWSAPETGWLESNWRRAKVPYKRIDPANGAEKPPIKAGQVLDARARVAHCFYQIEDLIAEAADGKVKDSDVIFLDDFFHPGLEALKYAFHLMNVRPRVYAFLHAQSVDHFDFTYGMRRWLRPVEVGFGEILDGIFVCCPTLRDLVVHGGIAPWNKVHVTGHPFNSREVMSRMPAWYREGLAGTNDRYLGSRENKVVYSSRFDREKNPHLFMDVVERFARTAAIPGTKFVVCTSAPELRSTDPRAVPRLRALAELRPDLVQIRENLTKEAYYEELCTAKVQFNCADQDFVPITLQEASVAGCYPVYPYFRSFPETFLNRPGYMYQRGDVQHATDLLAVVLQQTDLWSADAIGARSWVHRRFDTSWLRMLRVMYPDEPLNTVPSAELAESRKDPFDPAQW